MGGGQANKGQAAQANAAANESERASAALSDLNRQEQEANYNLLFGKPGSKGGGTLSGMLDPASLTTAAGAPQGAYKVAYNNATNQLAQGYNQARGSLARAWGGTPASMLPNGFQAEQGRQLERDQADTRGNLFASTVGKQYDDALSNFWNATNVASGQAASARGGALQGAANEGSTAASIYGTAGQYHAGPAASLAGSALGAGGQVGAAALCPARGALIRTKLGEVAVEELRKGVQIYQRGGSYSALEEDPVAVTVPCVTIITDQLRRTTVGARHAFCDSKGGYVEAKDALHRLLAVPGGWESKRSARDSVVAVNDAGELEVFPLKVGGNHTYLCDGIWSLD